MHQDGYKSAASILTNQLFWTLFSLSSSRANILPLVLQSRVVSEFFDVSMMYSGKKRKKQKQQANVPKRYQLWKIILQRHNNWMKTIGLESYRTEFNKIQSTITAMLLPWSFLATPWRNCVIRRLVLALYRLSWMIDDSYYRRLNEWVMEPFVMAYEHRSKVPCLSWKPFGYGTCTVMMENG